MKRTPIYNITSGVLGTEGSPDFTAFMLKKDAVAYARKNGFKYNKKKDLWLNEAWNDYRGLWLRIDTYDLLH